MRVQVTPERVELTENNAVEVFVTVNGALYANVVPAPGVGVLPSVV